MHNFRKRKRSVDQTFALKIIVEKYLEKGWKLLADFMGLENIYDTVERKGLLDFQRACGMAGNLLEGGSGHFPRTQMSVCTNRKLSENFGVGARQGVF